MIEGGYNNFSHEKVIVKREITKKLLRMMNNKINKLEEVLDKEIAEALAGDKSSVGKVGYLITMLTTMYRAVNPAKHNHENRFQKTVSKDIKEMLAKIKDQQKGQQKIIN